jgi:hypothetical protein
MTAKRIDRRRRSTRLAARKEPTASKSLRSARKHKSNSHFEFIDAAARLLDLPIEPAWKPAVDANLTATLRLAASFMEFPLTDDAEPAPIFTA